MKYWFYSEGNILGPYAPCELLTLPAFAQDSLICLETSSGDNPGDWKPAFQVGEIAEALSVGTGKVISSGYGGVSDMYALETGFSQASAPAYENAPDQGYSYESLLNTIDGILKTGAAGPGLASEYEKTVDYNLMDKFDIRLSKIQEELEAARWEKNLLLEKMRMKDLEDREQRARIADLESRLKAALGQEGFREKELDAARREKNLLLEKMDVQEKEDRKQRERISESLRRLADIKDKNEKRSPAPEPEKIVEKKENVILKNLRPSGEIKPERLGGSAGAPREENGITSGKLKSLGGSDKSGPVFETSSAEPLAVPEQGPQEKPEVSAASGGGLLPAPSAADPLTRQPGGVIYDFTAVTPKNTELVEKVQSRTAPAPAAGAGDEPKSQSRVEPQAADRSNDPAARQKRGKSAGVPVDQRPAHEQTFYSDGALPQPDYQVFGAPAGNSQNPLQSRSAPGQMTAPETAGTPEAEARGLPGLQPPTAPVKPSARLGEASPQPLEKGAQPQFQNAWQAAENVSLSADTPTGGGKDPGGTQPEWKTQASLQASSPVSVSVDKTERLTSSPVKEHVEKPPRKGGKTAFLVILTAFAAIAAGGLGFFFLGDGLSFSEFSMLNFDSSKRVKKSVMPSQLEPQVKDKKPDRPASAQEESPDPIMADAQAPEKAAVPSTANESVKNAIALVKNYKISGGRGVIGGWFANSFLSGSAGGASEEWSATPLHGSILVVQYRLIRQKQDPLIYQFEVDVSKNEIIRGINNNAIELLDFSPEKATRGAASAPGPKSPVKKMSAQKLSAKAGPARRTARPREIPILPLPDAPDTVSKEADPTGFEDAQAEGGEKVKYIRAQESDEELF